MTIFTLALTVGEVAGPTFGPISISQKVGTSDTAQASFQFTAPASGWTIYGRFTSSYTSGDGKTEINGTGGFSIEQAALQGTNTYVLESNNNLVDGTSYDFVCYAVAPGYTGNHWEGVAGEVQPVLNGIEVSTSSVTISAIVVAPTDITGTLSVTAGALAGTAMGTLFANQPVDSWSEVVPLSAWADITTDAQGNGAVSVATGQVAPGEGTDTMGVRATNTEGSYDETQTITISAAGVSTGDLPATNANVTATSLSQLYTIVSAFETDFAAARTTYGVPTGEPIIGLDVNTTAKLQLNGYTLSERITIRGVGTLSRNSMFPTTTTVVGDWTLQNSTNIRIMAIQSNAQANAGVGNMVNGTNVLVECCVLNMKGATSLAGLAVSNSVGNGIYFYNSTNSGFRRNAIIGANFQLINGTQTSTSGSTTTGFICEDNVFDQVRGDHIRVQGGTNTGYSIRRNLFGGRVRNPGGDHSDALQVGAGQTTELSNSVMEDNVLMARQSYGNDSHPPVQFWWFGGGSGASNNNTFRQNFGSSPGRMLNNSGIGNSNSSAEYNTDFAVTDVPASLETSRYTATFACFIKCGTVANNIVSRVSSGAGNTGGQNGGIHADCPNSDDSDNAPAGAWDPQTVFTTRELKFSETLGAIKPPSSSVASHWDNSNPRGAHLRLQTMFDASNADHWKLRGWPIDALVHTAYENYGNELALATGTFSIYNSTTGANLG